jgi:hypothetical protein
MHQNIHPAQILDGLIYSIVSLLRISHVSGDGERAPTRSLNVLGNSF